MNEVIEALGQNDQDVIFEDIVEEDEFPTDIVLDENHEINLTQLAL
jgi:hypothetical protein